MKAFFRFIIGSLLSFKARDFLRQHHVQVIAVTGSIGKTSTKEAIYTVLKERFNVYSSKKSFNTEFGLSLAVLQEEESGFTSPLAWLRILRRVLFVKKVPYQKIVLEMGADKPGDLKKLMKIASPQISVVTNVNLVHLAEGQFKNVEAIAREKGTLIRFLPKSGVAVLNADDERVNQMNTPAFRFTYGVRRPAILMAKDVRASARDLKFTVTFRNESEKFTVPVVGLFQIYVLLPAIAVGLQMGMKLSEISKGLAGFKLPSGRMNPIAGIHKSQIIDSSYNASPRAVEAALDLLAELKAKRKIAALGTMNELGELSYEAHIKAGRKAAQAADILVAVGHEASILKKGAMEGGMKEEKIFTFFDSDTAGSRFQSLVKEGDLILVKGSQNKVRMERFVKALMKNPEQAEFLLCRQGSYWEKN
jgi:UDP-N-acetylmuramoyl-tripeptide--D-alanyl-D-alanine ligase